MDGRLGRREFIVGMAGKSLGGAAYAEKDKNAGNNNIKANRVNKW